jgi:hypothetical protein
LNNTCLIDPSCAPYWLWDKSGILNLTAPLKGSPLSSFAHPAEFQNATTPTFASNPFFLDADPYYLDALIFNPPHTGPVREEHETLIDLEMVSLPHPSHFLFGSLSSPSSSL